MSSSWASHGPTALTEDPTSAENKSKRNQSRQLLSCTKCRERKVKCDRIKPCSACCFRGQSKECEFVVGEGNEYGPIQQSHELRQLRRENERLKERLQAARLSHSTDEDDDDGLPDKVSTTGPRVRQNRFKPGDRIDNLYFGTPGLASIVSDFANLQVGGQSLTHTVPKGKDMFATDTSSYPFKAVASYLSCTDLLRLLPHREEIFACLDMFQSRAQSCSFPHTPDEITKKEIERFLADAQHNAERFPDMLALIFVTLATGLQMGQYDRNGGRWDEEAVEKTREDSDAFLTASMQALRNASFMNRPTLLGIQTLIMMGPYLTNSGRFLDAWTLFGTTIRLAHSIGLHRNPRFLDPVPPARECTVRQALWWWMLHMDQQYSVTLGRPLGISGFGDCPPPESLTTNATLLRLGQFIDHFTILARQILSSDGLMNVDKIDEFTDKLLGLWDTMPFTLQFNESWIQQSNELPQWPLEVMSASLFAKVQSFLILLNRQRVEQLQRAEYGDNAVGRPRSSISAASTSGHGICDQPTHASPLRGRSLVINSSIHILQTFLFFWHRNPAVLICWTMGQQAFNACMILILDAWETEYEQNEWLINQAFVVFTEMEKHGVHKLAELAVHRISEGLLRLDQRRREIEKARNTSGTLMRRSSAPHTSQAQQFDSMGPDTASLTDWSGDTVMGNTGMFLLEDSGLQSFVPQPFQPLGWNMVGGTAAARSASQPPSSFRIPDTTSSLVPVNKVAAAPFPVMSTPFVPSPLPVTNSPFAVGLQPRMPSNASRSRPASASSASASSSGRYGFVAPQQHATQFTPIDNPSSFTLNAGNNVRTRGLTSNHRVEKVPRSQPRRQK